MKFPDGEGIVIHGVLESCNPFIRAMKPANKPERSGAESVKRKLPQGDELGFPKHPHNPDANQPPGTLVGRIIDGDAYQND